jgi:hypothetical protein
MSPRPGGEADKFGNRFEGRWTVRQLLYVLLGQADSVTVEEAGESGQGAEFLVRRGNATQAHQVKRQRGNANEWRLQDLQAAGVLRAASDQVAAGREFHFVSIVPARVLDELADRARRVNDLQSFIADMLTNELQPHFTYLTGPAVFGSPEAAWRTLRDTYARWPDERDVVDINSGFAGLLLEGAEPRLAAVALSDLVLDQLNVPLDANLIERLLADYGLRRAQLVGSPTLAQDVQSALTRWKDSVARELLDPVIARAETADIWARLQDEDRVLFVLGDAGSGKSAVVHQTVQEAASARWPILAFRLDRLGAYTSTAELGRQIGIGATISPVSALEAVSRGSDCLLVIDQVDAVSLASGRMPASFDIIAGLLREASGFPTMRVVLACRKFDVDNDERIRAVVQAKGVSQVEVKPLPDDQVNAAVQAMGLDSAALSQPQRRLLSSPFNLVLLRATADQTDALSFASPRDLLERYWDRKRRNCLQRREPPPRFNDVIGRLVDAMSDQQRLAVSVRVLDHNDLADDAQVLESEHVLVRDGRNYAFFHESFFDYAFARRWESRNLTLVDFLLEREQELFRRGQVRQVLNHLHDDDPDRFIEESEALLVHPQIRFHIKDVVLAVLRAMPAPTSNEWAMVKRVIDSQPDFIEPLRLALRTLPWFDRLDAEGEIERLFSGDQAQQTRALEVALGGIRDRADRLAQILGPHAGRAAGYPNWLRWVTRFADLHTSRALLDLVIDALRRGEYVGYEHNLWMSAYTLADHEPEWAVDLLSAYLQDQPDALAIDDTGRVALLMSNDHAAIELTTKAADKSPLTFCEALLPYLLRVMQLTEFDTDRRPIGDRQFSYGVYGTGMHELEDAVEQGGRAALRRLATDDPAIARPLLEQLAIDPHETAQRLLYAALEAAGEPSAQWSAALLLEGDHRLVGTVEATAQLLAAISPHVAADRFASLEQAILQLQVSAEHNRAEWYRFTLLAALSESRLSDAGRRRLGELRRRFSVDQPVQHPAMTSGFVQSPISPESAVRMTDAQWLSAIVRYDVDEHDWTTLRGGAVELARLLQNETVADPDRFARLSLRLAADANVAYAENILIGLGNTTAPSSPVLVFDAIRHIDSLGHTATDRWLGWPLRKHLDDPIPDDIVQLLLDKAHHSPSPEEDNWMRDSQDSRTAGDRIEFNGINSARGECAQILGDIVVHDADGHRTALVAPELNPLALDPSVAVRSSVAHLIAACLRHARPAALQAFELLIQTDDRLLATGHAANLVAYIGYGNPAVVEPVIRRMLSSDFAEVRKVGGQLAGLAGLEWGLADLLATARDAQEPAARAGVASSCAHRLPFTSNQNMAGITLRQLADDPDETVRDGVAEVAGALRGHPLRPFRDVLVTLIGSPSFEPAVDQLLITLEHATDRIDDLALLCARRFVEVFGTDLGNLSTGAAGNADEVGRLVLRAYEQARTAPSRSAILDLIDMLLRLGAYRVDELVNAAERGQ